MGDSKVTVWEKDGEAAVAVERQMVTCRRRGESVKQGRGPEERSDFTLHHSDLEPRKTHSCTPRCMIIACG